MDKITLIEFFADWCSVCAAQAPILDELKRDLGNNVDLIKLNVENNMNIFKQLEIDAIPTMFIVNDGKIIEHVGFADKNKLISYIDQVKII